MGVNEGGTDGGGCDAMNVRKREQVMIMQVKEVRV